VKVHVWKDVFVDGRLVIKAGTPVYTRISELQKARMAGRKGHLELESLNVTAVDGKDVALSGGYDKSGKGKVGLSIALAAIVAWPLIFLKGKKAELEPGTLFDAMVKTATQVDVEPSAGGRRALRGAPSLLVEILYDELDPDGPIKDLPMKLESSSGTIEEASVVTVNDKEIPALPIQLLGAPAATVNGTVDWKALSKHFTRGMNRLGVRSGDTTVEVLVEIEL
jgi:hypothetical protein